MHSDGNILDIMDDLIAIGIDALNSQVFCMGVEEVGRRFAGRITFWARSTARSSSRAARWRRSSRPCATFAGTCTSTAG